MREKNHSPSCQLRRRTVLAGAAGLGVAALPGLGRALASNKRPLLVNSVRSLSNQYHATWNKGGEAFAKAMGLDYLCLVTEGDSEKGINDINAVLARTNGNCVINIDPNDTPDARPIIDACSAAKAYLMTQWSKPSDLHPWDRNPYWVAHCSFNGVTAGAATAEVLIKSIGGKGGIVALGGIQASTAANQRKQGLDSVLAKFPDVKLLDFQVADWQLSKASDITNSWITRFGEKIKGVWSENDDMSIGALEALRAAGMAGSVRLSGIDGTQAGVDLIRSGDFVATVSPDPYWQGSIGLAIPYNASIGTFDPTKQPKIRREFYARATLITKDNAEQFNRENFLTTPKIDFSDLWSRAIEQI